ncbi:MAG: DUF2971 domain-containing protein [Bryobacteraceae bacterium]
MAKRVYKFTSAKHGISNLQEKRLKLSTIDDLNDPFDLCPLDTRDPMIEQAANSVVTAFRARFAILCFSRNWDNLLLWSHYGGAHTGVCLGFDIPDGSAGENYDTDVLYQANLLQIRRQEDVNFDLASRLHRTKHESWSYEQEVRMFVGMSDPPDAKGLHWIGFGPDLLLREIIVGAQCHPNVSEQVEKAAAPHGNPVELSWAGMRPDAFLLVKQNRPPWWHGKVK